MTTLPSRKPDDNRPRPSEPAPAPERRQLLQRLAMLETQVKAMQRQSEVQLNALLGSITKMMALVDGSLTDAEKEELQAPSPTLPEPPPATAKPAASAPTVPRPEAVPGTMRVIGIGGGGEKTVPREATPVLPHLFQTPRQETPVANAHTETLRPDPPEPAPEAASEPVQEAGKVKAQLRRKVQQIEAWDEGEPPGDAARTKALILTPEELETWQETSSNATASAAMPPKAKPAKAAKPDAPADAEMSVAALPYPEDVQRSKRLMFDFKAAIQQVMANPLIPQTNELIAVEMRDELSWYSRLILEDFLSMHEKARNKASERWQSITAINPNLKDPKLFWDPEAVEDYRAYRTTTFISKFLDHLEGEMRELGEPRYYQLLDFLANVMGLARLDVECGKTTFNEAEHRLDPQQVAAMGDDNPNGRLIIKITKSGYWDSVEDRLLRPAIVILQMPDAIPIDEPDEELPILHFDWDDEASEGDEDDTTPLRQSADPTTLELDLGDEPDDDEEMSFVMHAPQGDDAFGEPDDTFDDVADFDMDAGYDEVAAPPEQPKRARTAAASSDANMDYLDIPTPMEVTRCQNHIFSLKMTVAAMTRDNLLPRSGKPLDSEIAELLAEQSTLFLRRFMTLHKDAMAVAREKVEELSRGPVDVRDPGAYWNSETVEAYQTFRTTGFIIEFLDKIEARIGGRRLSDHQELIDHLAMEMELGRIGISPNVTRFNPDRHDLVSQHIPPNADLRTTTILTVVKSGYTDMATGLVIRKALVTVKLQHFRPGGSDLSE